MCRHAPGLVSRALTLISMKQGYEPVASDTDAALRPSPLSGISFLQRIFFMWMSPLLAQGFKGKLTMDDVPAVEENMKSKVLLDRWRELWAAAPASSKPARRMVAAMCESSGQ